MHTLQEQASYRTTLRSKTRTHSFYLPTYSRHNTSTSLVSVMDTANLAKKYPSSWNNACHSYFREKFSRVKQLLHRMILSRAVWGTHFWRHTKNWRSSHSLTHCWVAQHAQRYSWVATSYTLQTQAILAHYWYQLAEASNLKWCSFREITNLTLKMRGRGFWVRKVESRLSAMETGNQWDRRGCGSLMTISLG